MSVADPDLQIRGVGGGGGHPDPVMGGPGLKKIFFWPFGSHFGLDPPLDVADLSE